MARVVVTGLGILAPSGNNVSEAWDNALQGNSGIGEITLIDKSQLPITIAGEIKNFNPENFMEAKEARRSTRFVQVAIAAAKEALDSADLTNHPQYMNDFGVSIGVGIGSLQLIEENTVSFYEKGFKKVSPFLIPYCITNMAAGMVSMLYKLKGPNICTTTACTSGTHGIGEAYLLIKAGMAKIMLAGGTEAAVSNLGISGFAAMKALCTEYTDPQSSSRPFDLKRNGFVMGEGAGLLVLEELEHAQRRGAKILAEMVGYGMSADANHITAPAADGEGAHRCMAMALNSSGVRPQDVDYINAHGTSTKLNDLCETKAIKSLFGDHAHKIAISSTKGVTGHCLGAAGGIEAIYTIKALQEQIVPPTANLTQPDPECDLDYTPLVAKKCALNYGLSNSFGFGGTNGSLLFKRWDNEP